MQSTFGMWKFMLPEINPSKSRLETLWLIVVGMTSARRVNLGYLACERPGAAKTQR